MGLTLTHQPGYADVSAAVFDAGKPALGIHMARLSDNAAFGVVRMEVFEAFYENGQTVALPVSPIDGYAYSRDELIYMWNIHYTFNDSKGWATGPGPLWYGAWKVDQSTGAVSCLEDYRTSNFPPKTGDTSDGNLKVFTVAQRGLKSLVIAGGAPSYTDLPETGFATDDACNQSLMQALNSNAKYGCIKSEFFYLGEYKNGDTVVLPTSPADGYVYGATECTFVFSWRWTTVGASPFQIPDMFNLENINDLTCSISSAGVVSCSIDWEKAGANVNRTDYGRVAVFCFTRRGPHAPLPGLPTLSQSPGAVSDNFVWHSWQIKAAAISGTSSSASLTLEAAETEDLAFDHCQLIKTLPGSKLIVSNTPVTFGGHANGVVPAGLGAALTSDTLAVTIDASHDYYVFLRVNDSSGLHRGEALIAPWTTAGNFLAYAQFGGTSPDMSAQVAGFDMSTIAGWAPQSTSWPILAAFNISTAMAGPSGGGSFPAFTEIDPNVLMPGSPLTATELKDISINTKVAVLTPEFFGPTDYANGSTVALPVSLVDGYTYSRNELQYVYELRTTKPASNIRIYQWLCSVNGSTGAVSIAVTRCQSGGGAVFTNDGKLSVLTIARRSGQNPGLVSTAATSTPPSLPTPDNLASSRLKANGV